MREKADGVGNKVAAPVHGPVVQAGAIQGDVHFHAAKDPVVPRQLPGATRHFVNRAVEQDMLTTLLAGARNDGVVLLSTISGQFEDSIDTHWPALEFRCRITTGRATEQASAR
ncbi:hypothetical protein AB0I53_00730 [Saccharopolyspora sp. NPDC050389]|uniref:hypothetical protein n=1 Tax=Saccharopolyspora sp. NPDC050389 TaxID=3155516 RepID=UPI0033D4BBA8